MTPITPNLTNTSLVDRVRAEFQPTLAQFDGFDINKKIKLPKFMNQKNTDKTLTTFNLELTDYDEQYRAFE